MNCLYITLFFNTVAGIVQTFIKSWNQLLYPPSHRSLPPALWTTSWFLIAPHHRRQNFPPARCSFRWRNKWKSLGAKSGLYGGWSSISHVHLLRWEIVWRKATRIWRDFGSALPFQTCLTQTKPVPPLSKEHGSQVNDQGRRQCCHNKHKKSPYRSTRDVSSLSGHASYFVCISQNFSEVFNEVDFSQHSNN